MSTDKFYVFRHLHRIDDESAEPPSSNPIHRQWMGIDIGRDEKKRLALEKLKKDYDPNPYLGNLPSRITSDIMKHNYLHGTIKRIVSSPFLRCIQTSIYLANLLGIDLITIDYRLSEVGHAIDSLHPADTEFIRINQIFDQGMAYINKFCQVSDSKASDSKASGDLLEIDLLEIDLLEIDLLEIDLLELDPISVVPIHEKEIFRQMLYDAKDNVMIRIVNQKDTQKISVIARDESTDAYKKRLKEVVEELQSTGTLIVTHAGGMQWKTPGFYMSYNEMNEYPVSITATQTESSYLYRMNKQKYMTI